MQYGAVAPVASQRSTGVSLPLVCAACGAFVALGGWLAAVAAPQNLHVRVQPNVDMQVGVMAARSARSASARPAPSTYGAASALAMAKTPPPAPAPVPAGGLAAPWLSVVAIFISAAAVFVSVWRWFQNRVAPAETAYYRPPEALPVPAPRKNSNRMDEIAMAVKEDLASRKNITPKQVILELQRGNARFWSGTPTRPEADVMERRALIIGQAPTVAILSCADSRVPVEILFDQGLGSMFVVRVAGNILDATAMGSLEFAVKYLGVKAVLVMGHEACGAVKGAMTMSAEVMGQQPAYLQTVLGNIKSNLNVESLNRIRDNRAQDREAVVANTSSQVRRLQENPLIAERIGNGSLLVAGAFYEITSGIVDFFTLDKNGLVVDV